MCVGVRGCSLTSLFSLYWSKVLSEVMVILWFPKTP